MSSSSTTPQPLWLRAETKPHEHRAALTPTTASKLIAAGFDITVERDPQRIFADDDYAAVGCKLVEAHSWKTDCPVTTPVLGLKEFPVSTEPLKHEHIMFCHVYKYQAGWAKVMKRFEEGGGKLYDLEFLNDDQGRRVAAFGYHAGYVGAATGCLALGAQQDPSSRLGSLSASDNEAALVASVKSALAKLGRAPRVLVVGALGRVGGGAVALFRDAGVPEENIVKWDMAETKNGGPFQEFLDVDILVNCIYLSSKIPHFLTEDFIAKAGKDRKLAVLVDVSCDPSNPHNPLPIYKTETLTTEPTVDVNVGEGNPPMTVIAIDHLPTLLPREASELYSALLLPTLQALPERSTAGVWTRAEALFQKRLDEAKSA